VCFTVKKNVKHPAPAAAEGESVDEGRHHKAPSRLLSLTVSLDVTASLEVLVNHLALHRAHRFERDGATVIDSGLGSLVGRGAQRDGATLAITSGVNHDRFALNVPLHREAIREVLDGVNRLTVMADQQSEVVTVVLGHQSVGTVVDLDGCVNAGGVGDSLE
jgi:hypothetical protein